VENATLIWRARRTPAWINSDHLTALGLLSMLGGSPDDTLARVRKLLVDLADRRASTTARRAPSNRKY
jgi:hypothetical protein